MTTERSAVPVGTVEVLAGINRRELERFIEIPTTSRAIREYSDSLR